MRTECLVLSEQDRVESRLTNHESRIAMGDPEDDDEEEEEEKKKREEDEDEEDDDGEDEEEPWKVNGWTRISIPVRTTVNGVGFTYQPPTHFFFASKNLPLLIASLKLLQA